MTASTWEAIILSSVRHCGTPCYVYAYEPIEAAFRQIDCLQCSVPVRQWLSFKTQPVAPVIRCWRRLGHGVEVVSEFEVLAARKEGYPASRILVNGVGKHRWLERASTRGIRVHFDSLTEIRALRKVAVSEGWQVGIRCHVAEECDPDEPQYGGQFGLMPDEVRIGTQLLRDAGLEVDSVHFHLRTMVTSPSAYRRALIELSDICKEADLRPHYVDCGGGLPVAEARTSKGPCAEGAFDLVAFGKVLSEVPSLFPECEEIWLENGRFLTARAAVLVIRVLDIKDRPDSRYLICDGGRTNHALVSDWECHRLFTIPRRGGPPQHTTVCGPNCMAYDRLARCDLPSDIEVGDIVVWADAGAYHVPWETRFSHGLAPVVWCDESGRLWVGRRRESFSEWWRPWGSMAGLGESNEESP